MFALLTSTLFGINHAYEYVAGPLTYENAKAYCKMEGSTLATIVSDADRAAARAEILTEYGAGGVYIGLEDVSQTEGGYFSYPDEPDDTCPIDQGGLCVPFWIDGEPLCVGKDGYTCTQFYQDGLDNQGGVNNDIPCDTPRPFLCNDFPPMTVCTNDIDWTCGPQAIVKCGEDGPFNFCFCDRKDALSGGDTVCVEPVFCGGPVCTKSSDCGAGSVCTPTSCCGYSHCAPLCPETVRRRRQLGLMSDEEFEEYTQFKDERRKLMEGEDPVTLCTNAYCENPPPPPVAAQAENGINDMNGLEDLMDNNKMELIELLSLNVMVSVMVTLFVLCMVYVCCFRGRQTMNKHEKDDKMKYDKVGGNVDEDEIDEMM